MSAKRIVGVLSALAVLFCLGVARGESPLAKRGTYRATLCWQEH